MMMRMKRKLSLLVIILIMYLLSSCTQPQPIFPEEDFAAEQNQLLQNRVETVARLFFDCPNQEIVDLYDAAWNSDSMVARWLQALEATDEEIAAEQLANEQLKKKLVSLLPPYCNEKWLSDFAQNHYAFMQHHLFARDSEAIIKLTDVKLTEKGQTAMGMAYDVEITVACEGSVSNTEEQIKAWVYFNDANEISYFEIKENAGGLNTFLQDNAPPQPYYDIEDRKELSVVIRAGDGKEIPYRVAWERWGGKIFDRPDVFPDYFRPDDLIHLEAGSIIEIEFLEQAPAVAWLIEGVFLGNLQELSTQEMNGLDYWNAPQDLDEQEIFLCKDIEIRSIQDRVYQKLDGNKIRFTIEEPPPHLPPPDNSQYVRTFELFCRWQEGENLCECEYGFVLLQ
jgi:hypothetical protein